VKTNMRYVQEHPPQPKKFVFSVSLGHICFATLHDHACNPRAGPPLDSIEVWIRTGDNPFVLAVTCPSTFHRYSQNNSVPDVIAPGNLDTASPPWKHTQSPAPFPLPCKCATHPSSSLATSCHCLSTPMSPIQHVWMKPL
jgi:hypothetical protein